MSYRQRIGPRPEQVEAYEIDKLYREVFGTIAGQKVLDHIVQQICGVDAAVAISSEIQAIEVLTRKNVGLLIARKALHAEPTTVEVRT